jgi:hypothetical protein
MAPVLAVGVAGREFHRLEADQRAILGPTDVQRARVQINLRPLEITQLGGPQAMQRSIL